ELLEQPPPEFMYMDTRPLEVDTTTSFLKITAHKDVITVGERDYIKDIDEDGEDKPKSYVDQNGKDKPKSRKENESIPPDIITDAFIRERFDINPAAPNWFKERIIAIG